MKMFMICFTNESKKSNSFILSVEQIRLRSTAHTLWIRDLGVYIVRVISGVVSRGGGANGAIAPIGLKSMQNSMLLAVLRLIFALKTKIAPPPNEIEVRQENPEMM